MARKLAKKYGIHFYDIEAHIPHTRIFDKHGEAHEVPREIRRDETRMHLYRKVLNGLPLLSKMHSDVILDDGFHREGPRDFFFKEAARYFNPVVVVWISSDEEHTLARMRYMEERGMIRGVDRALARRERMKQHFEPFKVAPLAFHYSKIDDVAVKRLWKLLKNATS